MKAPLISDRCTHAQHLYFRYEHCLVANTHTFFWTGRDAAVINVPVCSSSGGKVAGLSVNDGSRYQHVWLKQVGEEEHFAHQEINTPTTATWWVKSAATVNHSDAPQFIKMKK